MANLQEQILEHIIDMKGDIGHIKANGENMSKNISKINGTIENHEDRISSGERWRSNIKGKVSIISIITAAIITFIAIILERTVFKVLQ